MTEEATETEGVASEDEATKEPDQKWVIPDDEDRSVYRFVLAAARRARQLQSGQRPAIKTALRKPTKISMEEIRSGAVRVEIIPEGQPMPPEDLFGAAGRYDIDAMLAAESAVGEGAWSPSTDRPASSRSRHPWLPKG